MTAKIYPLHPTRNPAAKVVPIRAIREAAPLSPEELVPDRILRQLGQHDSARDIGQISKPDQLMLAMVLPDICGELLARRAAERGGAS